MARRIFLLILISLIAGGCASTQELSNDPRDPLEGFNRAVYTFNDTLDHTLLTPLAIGYRAITPEFAETGINNFYANLNDFIVAANNILQFKFGAATSDVGRIVVNSTIGLLGFIDVASKMGLRKHDEDFGQTLGYWGVGTGPYIMLPFLGPSNFRDGPSIVVDWFFWPLNWSDLKNSERNALLALDIIRIRAELLKLEEKTEELARGDRYIFIRDAFLDRREFLVNDGEISVDDDIYQDLEDY